MKVFRFGLVVMATALITFGLIGTAGAFHSGGVAECGGCHSMHAATSTDGFLLAADDPSSTCLNCHESLGDTEPTRYHISTNAADMGTGQAPRQMTPGGDFGWLKKTYTFTVRGTSNTEEGYTHGHNIVAQNYGYIADGVNTTSPGGGFTSANLGCVSCHDPHSRNRRLADNSIATTGAPIIASGSYAPSVTNPGIPAATQAIGVYRLLAGAGYTKDGVTFLGNPAAVVPGTYNRTEAVTQTRTAYGSATGSGYQRWGDWCKTCHADMHSEGGANNVHPTDQGLGTISGTYNSYVKTGDVTGSSTTSYLSLVPFMQNSADYATLAANAVNDDTALDGPIGTDQVSCLSCHRAHASGWEYMLRWNMEGEFITYNSLWPGTDTTPSVPQFSRGRTSGETRDAYYGRPATTFASYQRVLCNKCHVQD